MQAVGQLDQQHAHVLGNGEQQLAQVFGLGFLARDEVEALDLGQAVDDLADLGAEHLVDLGAGGVGILDGVVKQRHGDGGIVELEIGEDGGDFERMGEVRVTRSPCLAAMLLHAVHVSLVEQGFVGIGIIGENAFDEFVLTHHAPGYSRDFSTINCKGARPESQTPLQTL